MKVGRGMKGEDEEQDIISPPRKKPLKKTPNRSQPSHEPKSSNAELEQLRKAP